MRIHCFLCGISTLLTVGIIAGLSLSWWWLLPLFILGYVVLAVLELTTVWIFACATKNAGPTRARRALYQLIAHTTTWLSLLCGIRICANGLDKLPTDRPFLLVSNHLSNLDPLVTIAVLRGWELPFVSKPENFNIPFAGPIMRAAAFLPIDRENPRNAVATIKQAAATISERQLNMGIYPEGTRNKSGVGLLPFHHGSLKIATTAKCPIVVAALRYEKAAFPYRRTAHVHIIDTLDAAFVAANRTDTLTEQVQTLIAQQLVTE